MIWKSLLLFFTTFPLFASESRSLLHCLGKEELRLHQKREMGPHFKLNRKLIDEFSSIGDLDISKEDFQRVCVRTKAPSIEILRGIVTKGKDFFELPGEERSTQYQVKKVMLDSILHRKSELLLFHFANIESTLQTNGCIDRDFPEYSTLKERLRYLSGVVEETVIVGERLKTLASGLGQLSRVYRNCQNLANQREKERKKGKSSKKM